MSEPLRNLPGNDIPGLETSQMYYLLNKPQDSTKRDQTISVGKAHTPQLPSL